MLPSPTGWRCRGWSEGHERWCRPAAEMGRADFYESPSAAREGGAPAFGTSGIKKSEESPSRGVIYSEESPARRGGGSRTGLSPLVAQRAALRNEDLSTAGPASSKANSGVYLFMTSSVILTAAAAERADGAGSEQGLLIGGGGGGGFHLPTGRLHLTEGAMDAAPISALLRGRDGHRWRWAQESSFRGAGSSPGFRGILLCFVQLTRSG